MSWVLFFVLINFTLFFIRKRNQNCTAPPPQLYQRIGGGGGGWALMVGGGVWGEGGWRGGVGPTYLNVF